MKHLNLYAQDFASNSAWIEVCEVLDHDPECDEVVIPFNEHLIHQPFENLNKLKVIRRLAQDIEELTNETK
jgi:hypothetical protein